MAGLSHKRQANSRHWADAADPQGRPVDFPAWRLPPHGNRVQIEDRRGIFARSEKERMGNIRWLAALPFLAILVGTAFVNRVEPLVFGMPLVLAWLVAWVILTAVIMAIIFVYDPANKEGSEGPGP